MRDCFNIILSFVFLLFCATGNVSANTCEEVAEFVRDFNSGLPIQADEVTKVVSAGFDCRSKNITIVKEASIPITRLNQANKLWKTTVKSGWEKQICNIPEAAALTGYGWELIQRFKFADGAEYQTAADCADFVTQSAGSSTAPKPPKAREKPKVVSNYKYFNKCNSFGSANCYTDIVNGCARLYPPSDTTAQTQFNRMGCLSDSIYATLNSSSHEYQTFLNHYLIRKGYFEAALREEIAAFQAYEMSESLRNGLNSNLNSQHAGSSAKQRCLSKCLMNNNAGSGGSGIVQGLNYCANLCN